MALASLELLLSTSDLAAVELPANLLAPAASLAAIRAVFSHSLPKVLLSPRTDIRAEDVVLSELLNRRSPVAWVVAPEGATEQQALLQLAADCRTTGTLLVLTSDKFDLVLVPREACNVDRAAFAAFATRVEGVRFIAETIASRRVAVVLDLDSTLLESEHLPVQPPDWCMLSWKTVNLTQEPCKRAVAGRICRLPDEPHHAESVHAASWLWKGAAHNYRVRQRLGWSHLRDLLIKENHPGGKLSTYVMSHGRPLYIQTAWQILDPAGHIIGVQEFPFKVNSGRPDGVYICPEKSPCMGVGLRTVFQEDYNMRLGPMWCADDLPEVWAAKYQDSVFPVEAYKPSSGLPHDYDADGTVLRSMAALIMEFWQHCYGADGSGGVVAVAMAAAQRTLRQLSTMPIGSCDELFRTQEAISSCMSVKSFLEQQDQSSLPTISLSVDAAAPENDENAAVRQSKGAAAASFRPSVAEERALRPSSRQGLLPAVDMYSKAATGQDPATAAAAPQDACAALAAKPAGSCHASSTDSSQAFASVSIVDGNDGESRLVLVLGGQQQNDQAAEPLKDAVRVAEYGAVDVGAVVLLAEAAHLGDTEAEDAEMPLPDEEGSDETGTPGRKRGFAAIAGHDTLLGPGSLALAAVDL